MQTLPERCQTDIHAILDGDYDICEILIETGLRTDTGHDGCYGCTPLITSLQMEDDDIAHMLIRNSVVTGEMCAEAKYPGFTSIHLASQDESFLDSLELLLSEPSSEGDLHLSSPVHPLHFATARSNAAGLRCILEHYSNVLGPLSFEPPDKRVAPALDTSDVEDISDSLPQRRYSLQHNRGGRETPKDQGMASCGQILSAAQYQLCTPRLDGCDRWSTMGRVSGSCGPSERQVWTICLGEPMGIFSSS